MDEQEDEQNKACIQEYVNIDKDDDKKNIEEGGSKHGTVEQGRGTGNHCQRFTLMTYSCMNT